VSSPDCKAFVLALSATPFTPGLGKVFTNLINAATMNDLVNLGILVPMRIFSCRKPDMSGAETSGGEWTEKAAEERELVIVGDVVREWTRFAENRKTIVFGATILHCEEMTRQFNEAGIPAATFCADTPDDERARILREFSYGKIRVLVSVEALAKGFDVKDIGCVCDCRPLRKSLSTAIQMWGRGLRSSPDTHKEDCYLLDFSGNIIRFADDFSRIYFNGLDKLDDGEKLDKEIRKDEEREAKSCPKCGYTPMGKRCVGCGYEPAPKALEPHLPGEMTEIKLKNGQVMAADKVDLFCQLATYIKGGSITDPVKREKRVMALYKAIANEWPPREMKAATAPEVPPKRATVNKIKSVYTAWAHRTAS
jgi:superfamily II DNA or RNA helicase